MLNCRILVAFLLVCFIISSVPADPVPTYSVTFYDSVTGDNTGNDGNPYWWVSPGADDYGTDTYERPTDQTIERDNAAIGSRNYYEYVDIVQAAAGFDENYLYVGIKMNGLDFINGSGSEPQGLIAKYEVRLGNNSTDPFCAGGLLLMVDNPSTKIAPTSFNGNKATGYLDDDSDVGGTSISTTFESNTMSLSGYELAVISDGEDQRSASKPIVLETRINPIDPTIIEFALDYKAFGYSESDLESLTYLTFGANLGMDGEGDRLWNDAFSAASAGTPYGIGTQDIYQVDTLMGGPVPEPATLTLLVLGGLALLKQRKK